MLGQRNTVIFGTETFTSPTVYLSIEYLAATTDAHWEISSSGLSPQEPPSSMLIPAPNSLGRGNLDPGGDIISIIAESNPGSLHEDEEIPKAQQSMARIVASKQASMAITLNGSTLPVVQSGTVAVIGDQTLTIGGNAVVVQGQTVSLEPSGLRVASSQTLHFPTVTTPTPQQMAVWEDDNVRVTMSQTDNAVVLTSGAAIISIAFGDSGNVNGHRVKVPSAGGMIIIDGSQVIALGQISPVDSSSGPILLLAGGRKTTAEKLENDRLLLTSGSDETSAG